MTSRTSGTAWRTKRTCRNTLQQAEFLLKLDVTKPLFVLQGTKGGFCCMAGARKNAGLLCQTGSGKREKTVLGPHGPFAAGQDVL